MERIDISKVLKQKNPKLHKKLPKFIIRAFEWLICAKKINHVLDNYSEQSPVDFIESTLNYMGVKYTLVNAEKIPKDEKIIFAANHPLGGLDGLILAHGLSKQLTHQKVRLIVNDILMNLEPLRPIFVPVNKHGAQSSDYVKAQLELYDSQDAIITFPAGLCSRLIHGKITDTPWKRNFIQKAVESNRTIVPTFVEGRNSMFFYRLARWRVRLGLKVNIEMLFLPREMFAQKSKHLNIYFGEPVEIDLSKHSAAQWVDIIRKKTYELCPKSK